MKLHDPGTLKSILGKYGIKPSKGLGQHFLCSEAAVDSIANALAGCFGVCEIGPGPGVLTGPISKQSHFMIALELDERMIDVLHETAPKADVRKVDALTADLRAIIQELPKPRGVVSNLPYYITGALLNKIADARDQFSVAVLMMQREVAERVAAPAGNSDRGSLSVYLQTLFEINVVAQVPASAFVPPPKVDSTVLKLVPHLIPIEDALQPQYFRMVRLAFTQPRKTLANNLSAGLNRPRDEIIEAIEQIGLEEKVRSHDLTIEQWASLCRALFNS